LGKYQMLQAKLRAVHSAYLGHSVDSLVQRNVYSVLPESTSLAMLRHHA
jgi:hypothetical protein